MANLIELQNNKENKYFLYCEECGKPLDWNDKYHQTRGTCNRYCYGILVGVYV